MNRRTVWLCTLGLLAFGYMIQLFSPLRTNTDATCYMEMAASASDGAGFVCCKNAEHYPIGYPTILTILDRAGLACSASFIGINLAALAIGLLASASILRKSFGWNTPAILIATTATLLNWVMIKHATLPLTDLLYFGLSLPCLALLLEASSRDYPEKLLMLSGGLILLALAISVRTVGISLLPAIAFAALPSSSITRCMATIRSHKLMAGCLALGGVIVGMLGVILIARTNYFRELLENWVGVIDLATMRLDDWGELVLNVSMAKVPDGLRSIQIGAGASFAVLLVLGFAKRRRIQAVDVYMTGYLAILLAWPYRDARFWIPVFPLMLGYLALSVRPILDSRRLRWVAPSYLVGYTLMGLIALGYSTWLTFSGDNFGDRFAGGVYRDSYRVAFGIGPVSTSRSARVDPQIVRHLDRYRLDRPKLTPHSVASTSPSAAR